LHPLSLFALMTSRLMPRARCGSLQFFGFKVGHRRGSRIGEIADQRRRGYQLVQQSAFSFISREMPVILPLGRLRLAARPSSTGSAAKMETIGIDFVTALAAAAATAGVAKIIATWRRTRSSAKAGSRSR